MSARRRSMRLGDNRPPAGSRPGTFVVPPHSPAPRMRAVLFGSDVLEEHEVTAEGDLRGLCERDGTLWLDVQGLGGREVLEWIGASFGLHPLLLADVAHVPQRPKVEEYTEATFVVARRFLWSGADEDPVAERQISLVIGEHHLVSFQEGPDPVFDPVRARLEQSSGLLRTSGTDYLAYALLDAVVDDYLPLLDRIGERLEPLEDRVLESPSRQLERELVALRRQLLTLRRDLWPQREALHTLLRGDVGRISDPVKPYLRDVHDHCVRVAEMVEVQREIVAGIQNLYLTSLANRTNEVMKVLTVVSTIFIPLTFLVGVWGMNFRNMPELALSWGYPAVWLLMLGIAGGLFLYFRRRGWIGREPRE